MVLNNSEMIIHLKLNCLQSYYKYSGDKINYNYNSNFFFFENPIIIVTKGLFG